MNTIGERIIKLREEKNISQEKMALELNLAQSNYGRLEKDDKRLNAPKLENIAELLQITVSFLFNEQTSKVIHQTKCTMKKQKLIILTPSFKPIKNTFKPLKTKLVFLENYSNRIKIKDFLLPVNNLITNCITKKL